MSSFAPLFVYLELQGLFQIQHINLTNFQVNHGKFLPPAFMEGVMDMVGLAMAVFTARGTASYEELLKQLPEEYKDSYHKLIQVNVKIQLNFSVAQ